MEDLLDRVLAETDEAACTALLAEERAAIDEGLLLALKDRAGQLLRVDVHKSLAVCDVMLAAAAQSGQPRHKALGLLARANALTLGGLGRHEQAIELYDEAARIYHTEGCPADEANTRIGHILALASLGRYEEALRLGAWAAAVLAEHDAWWPLARLTSNLGIIYGRRDEEANALAMFDKARDIYRRLGTEDAGASDAGASDAGASDARRAAARAAAARGEGNRALILANMGRFQEAIAASELARAELRETGQPAEVARAEENLGTCLLILGRYNEGLAMLARARAFFLADGREGEAVWVDQLTAACLLQLRRYHEVLDVARQGRELFGRHGTPFEVAQSLLNEAAAYAGLGRADEALATLVDARRLFEEEGNARWAARTDVETALALLRVGRPADSLTAARRAQAELAQSDLPVELAQATLAAARAALALGDFDEAARLVSTAAGLGQKDDLAAILYPCYQLMAALAEGRRDLPAALDRLDSAIEQMERLRRRLMVEYRADFLEDRQIVYEDAVAVAAELHQPERALAYAERARSRALLDLLDYRIDIGIRARSPEDEPVVAELNRLIGERNTLYGRWVGGRKLLPADGSAAGDEQAAMQQRIQGIEKRITGLWHDLLIRNAGYASDAALWPATAAAPEAPSAPEGTLLLEYVVARDRLIAFLVSGREVRACPLPARPTDVRRLMGLFQMNVRAATGRPCAQVRSLADNARGLLAQLYSALVGPLADLPGRPLAGHPRLVIVPSGWLHYLPFHALYDGSRYLAATHEISYLPGAGLLRHLQSGGLRSGEQGPAGPVPTGGSDSAIALGLAYDGALPYAAEEAGAVARLLGGRAYLEDEATLDVLRDEGSRARVIHLAAHGEFRPDNPLFSGVALAGGWLTTLDTFGLRLQASLVTLSACQTGRSVVGGGDELLGLTRAFLAAGAASLLLSLWPVEDQSTLKFMRTFYSGLAGGQDKSAALRSAQVNFIDDDLFAHPYYWAPFVLIGHTGPLAEPAAPGIQAAGG